MKNLRVVGTVSVFMLALTVACSSNSKVEDSPLIETAASTEMVENPPMPETTDVSSLPSESVTEESTVESQPIPDEVTRMASLGASSSGRSR